MVEITQFYAVPIADGVAQVNTPVFDLEGTLQYLTDNFYLSPDWDFCDKNGENKSFRDLQHFLFDTLKEMYKDGHLKSFFGDEAHLMLVKAKNDFLKLE